MSRGLYLHGYEEKASSGTCDACSHCLAGKPVYDVSYDGVRAKYLLCSRCFSVAKRQYGGIREPEGA